MDTAPFSYKSKKKNVLSIFLFEASTADVDYIVDGMGNSFHLFLSFVDDRFDDGLCGRRRRWRERRMMAWNEIEYIFHKHLEK